MMRKSYQRKNCQSIVKAKTLKNQHPAEQARDDREKGNDGHDDYANNCRRVSTL